MSYVPIDLSNDDHKRAHEYYRDTGHPECRLKGEDVEIDLEYREYLVKKFKLNFDEVAEGANGSTHIVVDNNPLNYKLKIAFFADNSDHNFGVEVTGKLRFNTDTQHCIFFPEDGSVRKISIDGDKDFDSSVEMYYNRGAAVNL